ncbi:MAG: class I SAM-dependent methyltransferase [Candidatus Paceibacterota bacterium]|jgi:SAM-dependent methyltransferase
MSIFREHFKKWPRFYYFFAVVFGPLLLRGLSPKRFLCEYTVRGTIINLGSGPKIIAPGVTNMDIAQYPGVDIIGDASDMPLASATVDAIISDTVFEHLRTPGKAIQEVYRVLKPNGLVYITVPFIYPFHSSPSDFTRWTKLGLIELLSGFEILEIGVRAGPFSSLTVIICYLVATIFSVGNDTLYWFLLDISMILFFPVKLLDFIFSYWPKSIDMAAVVYCVAKKPPVAKK